MTKNDNYTKSLRRKDIIMSSYYKKQKYNIIIFIFTWTLTVTIKGKRLEAVHEKYYCDREN